MFEKEQVIKVKQTELWKAQERKIARLFNGERTHKPGKRSADVMSKLFVVEVKTRKKLPEWQKKALATARGLASDYQLGIVEAHEVGARDGMMLVSRQDFIEWFGTIQTREE